MMKQMKQICFESTGTLLLASLLAACAPKGADLQSLPRADLPESKLAAPAVSQRVFARKVDILFVIDTSESMDKHQARLKANIDRFVDSFVQHADVDFHIGVVSTWDSTRYSDPEVLKIKTPYPIGLLRPLKDPRAPSVKIEGPQYVTRKPGFAQILGESLKVGVELKKDGGPEFEEMFSPILPALESQNGDFYRPDAHLAIVMLTDADDSTPNLTAGQLRDLLVEKKRGDHNLVSVYGALALNDCQVDPGRKVRDARGNVIAIKPPRNIQDLISLTGGSFMNLCDPEFGEELGKIGRSIEQKASTLMRIRLDRRPNLPTLEVSYALPNGAQQALAPGKGFSYDEEANEIIIHGEIPLIAANPGGQISLRFTPFDYNRKLNRSTKVIGRQ